MKVKIKSFLSKVFKSGKPAKALSRKERIEKALAVQNFNTLGIVTPTHNLSSIEGLNPRYMEEFELWARNLSDPSRRSSYKKHMPRGYISELIILDGETGTGKSYLAQAIAGSIRNSVFINLDAKLLMTSPYINQTQVDLLEHFERFKVLGDMGEIVVVYLDESETVLSKQTDGQNGFAEDNLMTIGRFLSYFDGIEGAPKNLIFITATNMFNHIDNAMVRAGRLRRYRIDGPLRASSVKIVRKYLKIQFELMGYLYNPDYTANPNGQDNPKLGLSKKFEAEATKLLDGLTPVEIRESIDLSAKRTMSIFIDHHARLNFTDSFETWKYHNEEMVIAKWSIELKEACKQLLDTGK